MNLSAIQMLGALVIGHAVADYPLQGDFLAKAKNRHTSIPGIDWWVAMAMHCLIHGGMVWAITGNMWLGYSEFTIHFLIDCSKCDGLIDFKHDQLIHLSCKGLWMTLARL